MTDTRLILGGPGTGKTTFQLAQMERFLEQGVAPNQVAFVSFTKAAVDEAKARAISRFNLEDRDLPYFRTIHSLCFRALGLRRDDVLSPRDWGKISEAAAVDLTPVGQWTAACAEVDEDIPGDGATQGDQALSLIQYARAVRSPLETVWREYGADVPWHVVDRLNGCISQYKQQFGKYEFADMLSEYIKQRMTCPVKVAIIDEAQDLTAAQWSVVRTGFAPADTVLVSGDDDQAIHTWAGAATKTFLAIEAPRTVLPMSYRLSPQVFGVVQNIAERIQYRFPKDYAPHDHQGRVTMVNWLDDVQLDPDAGSWMILVRSHYQLRDVAIWLREQGLAYRTRAKSSVPFSHVRAIVSWERRRAGRATPQELEWADEFARPGVSARAPWYEALTGIAGYHRDYYRAIVRSGRKLSDEPNILISTIHGVKGQEADHVILLTDLTQKIATNMGDGEHRVFLVGASRARHSLTVVTGKDSTLEYRIW